MEAGLKSAFGGVFTVAAASVPVGEVLLQCLDATPGHLLYWREVAPTPPKFARPGSAIAVY